jgi:membrane-bound lytic murein transglycosylase MltF
MRPTLVLTEQLHDASQALRADFGQVAKETGTAESWLAALCWRESDFGLALSPDGTGDGGHGHGLMQIDDRFHGPWLAVADWRHPLTNIRKGTSIYLDGYHWLASRGLVDGTLIHAAIAAYNAGPARVLCQVRAGHDPDEITTGGDYARWVEAAARVLENN